jgi:hypothetical protein
LNVRKVVVYELLSLDGVAEKPDGFFADWDDAMEVNLGAVIAAQDSVILGRPIAGSARGGGQATSMGGLAPR